jgi:hypothetical protein
VAKSAKIFAPQQWWRSIPTTPIIENNFLEDEQIDSLSIDELEKENIQVCQAMAWLEQETETWRAYRFKLKIRFVTRVQVDVVEKMNERLLIMGIKGELELKNE